jgi:hypothetical protein
MDQISPDSAKLFERWVKAPIDALRRLPNGDGAFAALGIAFAMYERYIKSALAQAGLKETPEQFFEFGANDLRVEVETFKRFWQMYRDGIQHSLQPKRYTSNGIRWGWEISGEHLGVPTIITPEADLRIIRLEPWSFVEQVLARYESRPELIDFKDTWKFGVIEAKPQVAGDTPITRSAQSGNSQIQASGTGIAPARSTEV